MDCSCGHKVIAHTRLVGSCPQCNTKGFCTIGPGFHDLGCTACQCSHVERAST